MNKRITMTQGQQVHLLKLLKQEDVRLVNNFWKIASDKRTANMQDAINFNRRTIKIVA